MPKLSTKSRSRLGGITRKAAKSTRVKPKSLAALNTWMRTNYSALLANARQNCIELTGKPTFGSSRRRKSA